MNIISDRVRNGIVKGARSLLLAYAVLYMTMFWSAEETYNRHLMFKTDCETVGGFITFTDGSLSCTRLRPVSGMFQL